MAFVIDPPLQPSVAVQADRRRFPVRRVFCVGRNYRDHAREMGKDPDRDPPFFFMKPTDALVDAGETVAYPPLTKNLHYEAELVVAIGKAGANVSPQQALDHVFGYAVGNDLTRRDVQLEARAKGLPWEWGKAFDRSAVCGPIHAVADVGHIAGGAITLWVNGEVKQKADLSDMIWDVPNIIAFLSQSVAIEPGDLVYTGTPAGVGPLVPGDTCIIQIDALGTISTTIGAEPRRT